MARDFRFHRNYLNTRAAAWAWQFPRMPGPNVGVAPPPSRGRQDTYPRPKRRAAAEAYWISAKHPVADNELQEEMITRRIMPDRALPYRRSASTAYWIGLSPQIDNAPQADDFQRRLLLPDRAPGYRRAPRFAYDINEQFGLPEESFQPGFTPLMPDQVWRPPRRPHWWPYWFDMGSPQPLPGFACCIELEPAERTVCFEPAQRTVTFDPSQRSVCFDPQCEC